MKVGWKTIMKQQKLVEKMTTEEKLDETDIRILKLLQQNSRLTVKEPAARVHLSPSPTFERQKRLERCGDWWHDGIHLLQPLWQCSESAVCEPRYQAHHCRLQCGRGSRSEEAAPGSSFAAGLFGTSSAAHVLHKALRKRDQPEGHPIGHGA